MFLSLFFLALMLVVLCLAMDAPMESGARCRVVVDQAHGNMKVPKGYAPLAEQVGAEIVTMDGPATAEGLRGARAYAVLAPTETIAATEAEAVRAFVRTGGSLLLVLDEEIRQSLAVTQANALIEEFGLRLTPDTEYLHNCGAIVAAGAINAAAREVPYSGGRGVDGGTAFGWRLDAAGERAEVYAAYVEVAGGGRIVVLAEAMAAMLWGIGTPHGERLSGVPRDPKRTTYWGKDSAVFMREVLAWLLRRA